MLKRLTLSLSFSFLALGFLATPTHALELETRAELLNAVQGDINQSSPQPVRLIITQGPATGCEVTGTAFLNKQRQRYEYTLNPTNCIKNGQPIHVGTVVRGQHNIKGTMANSGMGRDYFVTNKGVTVTLTDQ